LKGKSQILEEIEPRLRFLEEDIEPEESDIFERSKGLFLAFVSAVPLLNAPDLGVTNDGEIVAEWHSSKHITTMHFSTDCVTIVHIDSITGEHTKVAFTLKHCTNWEFSEDQGALE